MEEITYEKVMMDESSNAIIQLLNISSIQAIPERAHQTSIPPHWHRSIEFSLVRHGRINVYVNNEKKQIQDGEFIFVNSAQIHQLYPAEDSYQDYEVLLVIISYEFIKKMIPNIDELCFDIDVEKPSKQRFLEIYDFFYHHCLDPQPYDDLCINAYLQELLYLLMRDYQADPETSCQRLFSIL